MNVAVNEDLNNLSRERSVRMQLSHIAHVRIAHIA